MASSAKEGRIWGQLSLKGGDFLESSGAQGRPVVVPGCLVQAAGRLRASEGRALHREAKDPDYLAPPCVNSRVTLSTPQSSPSPCFLSYETGERLG